MHVTRYTRVYQHARRIQHVDGHFADVHTGLQSSREAPSQTTQTSATNPPLVAGSPPRVRVETPQTQLRRSPARHTPRGQPMAAENTTGTTTAADVLELTDDASGVTGTGGAEQMKDCSSEEKGCAGLPPLIGSREQAPGGGALAGAWAFMKTPTAKDVRGPRR
jgi:hypothetical protein